MGVICRLLFLPYAIVFLEASEFQVKLAIGTWITGIVMSRCIVVNEENLVVWWKMSVGLHQEILESLGSHASYLGGMTTSSCAYSNNNGYMRTSLPAYLSALSPTAAGP